MDKRFPSDGSLNRTGLTFELTSAVADTLAIQVVDAAGNSVAGFHTFIITGDTVNEDIGLDGATAAGTCVKLTTEAAGNIAAAFVITDASGAYTSGADAATGVLVNATMLSNGTHKSVTIA